MTARGGWCYCLHVPTVKNVPHGGVVNARPSTAFRELGDNNDSNNNTYFYSPLAAMIITRFTLTVRTVNKKLKNRKYRIKRKENRRAGVEVGVGGGGGGGVEGWRGEGSKDK